jgi:hypothetical protein
MRLPAHEVDAISRITRALHTSFRHTDIDIDEEARR